MDFVESADGVNEVRIENLDSFCSSGQRVCIALGLSWASCVNSRLFLSKYEYESGLVCGGENGSVSREKRRRLHVVFAPHLPSLSWDKALIKSTKNQIEVIRRKRNATLKFLKKDMADLLANGLDINAYGRAEGLLAELNQLSCYDFVEQFCDFVLKHLSVLQKLRLGFGAVKSQEYCTLIYMHCPEDCREAVSSLMFAAAGLNNLPELRDLRDVFYERYGNSLDFFVNQEFVEKLSSKLVTTEKKIHLMQNIATEFSITWDSNAFEQRMSKTPKSKQDQTKIHGSLHSNDDRYMLINDKDTVSKEDKQDFPSKERLEDNHDRYKFVTDKESTVSKRNEINSRSRLDAPSTEHEPIRVRGETILKRDNRDILFQGRQEAATVEKDQPWKEDTPLKTVRLGGSSQWKRMESVDGGLKRRDGRENTVPRRDGTDTTIPGKPDIAPSYAGLWSKNDGKDFLAAHNNYGGQHKTEYSKRGVLEEEVHKLKPYYNNAIPPPYTKTNAKLTDARHGATSVGTSQIGSDFNAATKDPSRDNIANSWNSSEKFLQGFNHPDHERQNVGLTRENGHGIEKRNYYQDDGISNPIPKPRSMRRRHSKSHSSHDDAGNSEDTGGVKRRSRSRRKDDSRKGLQILFDDDRCQNDEEERVIDKLLIHYSKKPSAHEPGKVRRKSKSRHAHQQGTEADRSPQHISRDRPDEISEMVPAPPRSISLPREQTNSAEARKVFTRAASFQPDRSSPARHVHPKLPDYDDLAARFAALKGRVSFAVFKGKKGAMLQLYWLKQVWPFTCISDTCFLEWFFCILIQLGYAPTVLAEVSTPSRLAFYFVISDPPQLEYSPHR
ncbi:unnamed protein product [Dovyalis caffra]|uniref:Uncharacterized protein n=1 Tax=Dovyalis caffra TaxID=77055 RepID=A0AAV1RHG1_9ROSI|nr:unnamed protein product [Dovyalis caffra]